MHLTRVPRSLHRDQRALCRHRRVSWTQRRVLCESIRLFLHHASVHSGILAGIYGNKHEGCYSVVLSGQYEDDKDEGYRFTYTGCGGRDTKDGEKVGPQTCDQSWNNSRNMSLRVSAQTKKPVRVVRGYKSSSDFAPVEGYRYDGLYTVESAWMDVGKSGFQVCKYLLKVCVSLPSPLQKRPILICVVD
ncbi:SRA-YDG [Trametes versicolor FP-101664 SS1]|uniref:SRA-YDG n=1 Tax=Trametes versicolor (strain FP-101664) TaxID=717944 RepID=UPI000462281C|nr:SRA-YDG [Trametes versicolor FP-101664 SS1]EIW59479.1 SRA-YDG [Trametes versicolor FP-101664 SS1]